MTSEKTAMTTGANSHRRTFSAHSLCHQSQSAAGVKLMPHRRPEDRVYTVISGVFYIDLGDTFDADKLHAYPPANLSASYSFQTGHCLSGCRLG